jgi:ribosomal protein S20
MPNTKSAERRMRNSERKNLHNRSIKSNVRRVEKDYRALLTAGKKDEAKKLLPQVHSTLDKAVNRKKSRLAAALN